LYGLIPSVLFKKEVNDQLEATISFSSEMNAIEREFADKRVTAKVNNLNLEGALSYDADPNLNLAGGFLFRLRDPFTGTTAELRPWQQASLLRRVGKYRLRTRLRVEERWRGSDLDFDLRLRYRISADVPLEGQRLDSREFYLNASTEALLTPTRDRAFYFWQGRIYLGLGYQFNDRQRLEPALDFRTQKVDETGRRENILFLRLIWVNKLVDATSAGS
jgi:hypothetical protein